MAERLHPGVYVEERRRGLTAIQGVSTSNYGTVGFTPRGPTDVATLATGFDQATRIFGSFNEDSQMLTHVFAFFANGGVRAYIVRVVASDAVASDGFIGNPVSEEVVATGNGVNKIFAGTLAKFPVRPGSGSITYREAGVAVVAQAGTYTPAVDGVAGVGAVISVHGRIVNANAIVPGTVTISTLVSAAPVTYTDPAKDGILKNGGFARGFIDYKTGHWNLSFELTGSGGVADLVPDAASVPSHSYTPVGTERTVTDDGVGALQGATLTAPGTIDYATGDVAFTVAAGSAAPHDLNPVLADYIQNTFDVDPISKGVWGDGVQLQVRGNEDFFTRSTSSYSKHDVLVLLDGDIAEVFSAVQFTDPSGSDYVISALNEPGVGSSLVRLVEPSNADEKPSNLDGKLRTRGVGAGNGVATEFGSTATADPDGFPDIPVGRRSLALQTPIQPASIVITYTETGGTLRTITDDGDGSLIGDVDPAAPVGFNQVDYETGKFAFKTVASVSEAETTHGAGASVATVPGSIASISYRLTPASSLNTDALSGGSDGVAPIGRNQLTDPALKEDREGMYALLKTDELINLAIPDAAGDVTMAVDQVSEAETNGKWFAILATPPGLSPQQARDYRRNQLGITSSYGALYWPYITIADPVTDRNLNVPPQGHIAGIYARTDGTRSVGKAPAGTVDGRLGFSVGLERRVEFSEIDILHNSQVNALIDTPQTGRVVWGARTLENPPDDFKFIHVRRLFNFLKASIFNSTHGFVFESVGATLRGRIQITVETFLLGLFNQGLFAGSRPQDAFLVICDETNNPPEVENAGEVICDVYVAANTPGEFIVFRISQRFAST